MTWYKLPPFTGKNTYCITWFFLCWHHHAWHVIQLTAYAYIFKKKVSFTNFLKICWCQQNATLELFCSMSIWKCWENLFWSVQIFLMESCYGHKILAIHLTKLFWWLFITYIWGPLDNVRQNMLGEFIFWSEIRDIPFDAPFQPNFEGN